MLDKGSCGIIPITLVIILLVGGLYSMIYGHLSVLYENGREITKHTFNEIATYLMMEDAVGKMDGKDLDKLLIFVKPILPVQINLSRLCLYVKSDNLLSFYCYGGHSERLKGEVFESQVWTHLEENEFGVFTFSPQAGEVVGGTVCIAISVSQLHLHPGDGFSLTLVPEEGAVTHFELRVPITTSSTVHFNV